MNIGSKARHKYGSQNHSVLQWFMRRSGYDSTRKEYLWIEKQKINLFQVYLHTPFETLVAHFTNINWNEVITFSWELEIAPFRLHWIKMKTSQKLE